MAGGTLRLLEDPPAAGHGRLRASPTAAMASPSERSWSAPSACDEGHVCDHGLDLMTAELSEAELDSHVLDAARNDYYGHGGGWIDGTEPAA